MPDKKTLVINFFAGPGAGKTTCAWEVASELKKQGYVTEYVPEYAKELVWDENLEQLDGSLEHQQELLGEQEHRLQRLVGKVDFIVTDSPILLNPIYLDEGRAEAKKEYEESVFQRFSKYNNFCVFIERGDSFERDGRIHDLNQSRQLDQQIKGLLDRHHLFYGTYAYATVHYIVPNCIKTFGRINSPGQIQTKAAKTETPLSQEESVGSLDELVEKNSPQKSDYHFRLDEMAAENPEEDLEL